MKKHIMIVLAVLGYHAMAQSNEPSRTFELEVDPIAYMLNGYSVHAIYNPNRFRIDLGVYGIEQPQFAHGNEGFTLFTSGAGVKVNYLFQGVRGFYAGADLGYAANRATENATGLQDTGHSIGFGIHAGYRYFPFYKQQSFLKGLYLNPWAGISLNYIYDKVSFQNVSFKESSFGFFPTVHIGYRF